MGPEVWVSLTLGGGPDRGLETGEGGSGVLEHSGRCRPQGARMSRQLCTWPRERQYPDSCHRKPQLGRGLRLRVTTFPGGRGPRPLCSLLGPAYGGAGGAGRVEASSTSSPLSASPSFACCILFPFFLSLPFVTKSCRQPCGPVRLPQGGQPQSGCLTRGCGHSETRVLLHPEDGRANP